MANQGTEVGTSPVDLVSEFSLVAETQYTIQNRGPSEEILIGDFGSSGEFDMNNAFRIRAGEGYAITAIPETGSVYCRTANGKSRVVLNES